jgi:hypothetical protein
MYNTGKFGHTVMFIARFVFMVPVFSLAVSTAINTITTATATMTFNT